MPPVRVLRASVVILIRRAPKKADQKLLTWKPETSCPTNARRRALMMRANRPRERMTRGSDRSRRSGRRRALRIPRVSDATSSELQLVNSMPGMMLAATMTATVVTSHRCRNRSKGGPNDWVCRSTFTFWGM